MVIKISTLSRISMKISTDVPEFLEIVIPPLVGKYKMMSNQSLETYRISIHALKMLGYRC